MCTDFTAENEILFDFSTLTTTTKKLVEMCIISPQISLYEGSWELASACAALLTKCDVPLEDQLDVSSTPTNYHSLLLLQTS